MDKSNQNDGMPEQGISSVNNRNESLLHLQQVNLQMIHAVDEICRQYGLTYYALGGTLLGAVRHHGFIPWDDDVDLGMPRPDYERFLRIAQQKLPDSYRLRTIRLDDDYRTYMVKVEDLRVSFYREYYTADGRQDKVIHAWIDIMPIDGGPGSRKALYRQLKKIRLLKQMVSFSLLDKCMGTAKSRSSLEKKVISLGLKTGLYRLLSTRLCHKLLEGECCRYSYEDSPLLGNYYGIYGRREFVRRAVFGTPSYLEFEDMKIPCPQDYDHYLRHVYGDYMELPPQEERRGHEIRFA